MFSQVKSYVFSKVCKNKSWYSENVNASDVGIYVDNDGVEHRVKNKCPHMGCSLIFNEKEKTLLYCSNEIHPLQSNIYKVRAKDGKRSLLDNGEGVHYGNPNADGSRLIDRYSSPTVTRSIGILDTKNGKSCNLLTAGDPWKEYNVPEISSGSIKAADGVTDLYYRMVKPVDFDPAKKYPTVVYVYGGPHAHNVEASRNYYARGWEIYMAQKGYLLFILDNRGSEHRGLDRKSTRLNSSH